VLFIGSQTAKVQRNLSKQTIATAAFVRSPQNTLFQVFVNNVKTQTWSWRALEWPHKSHSSYCLLR